MKGFSKVRFAPIDTSKTSEDGYPVYKPFVKLYEQSEEFNNVSLAITDNTATSEKRADNLVKNTELKESYSLTLEVYGYDIEGAVAIFGSTKDANGNEILVVNSKTKPRGCLFFETISDDNKRIQNYLYDVELSAPPINATTGLEDTTISITGTGKYLSVSGKQIQGAKVFEGNTGFVDASPTSVYKEAVTTV